MNNLPEAATALFRPGKQTAKAAVIIRDHRSPQPPPDFAKVARHPNERTVSARPLPWPLFA